MLEKEKIDRINALARKSKEDQLTKAEEKEQEALRKEYLNSFRNHFKSQLDRVKVVDESGNEIPKTELAKSKKHKHKQKEN